MKVSKEFKVGLLVVLGLLLLFVGVNFLKGGLIFGKSREFYAVFTNASGLKPSNEVQLNGVKIGQVLEVGLHPLDPQKILVKFNVDDKELQIPANSEAWLISSDLLGTKCLDLRLDTLPMTEHSYYEDGDTVLSNIEVSLEDKVEAQLLPLKQKTEELIGSVEGIVVSINAFWDTSAAYTIEESMYEVREAIGTFGELANNLSILISQETEMVGKILKDVHTVTDNLANKSEQISNTIDNISAISDTLSNTDIKGVIAETKTTLTEINGVLSMVNSGEGTLGSLLHSDSLYNALVNTNESVQHLLDDMAANPNKYVHFSLFGRKVKGVQLTTEEEKKLKNWLQTQP
ncbi:MAG: MCE family protein [Bacteroidetes bacterium]|nr:MCE family protein [Bacteroidota bacterium]